MQKCSANFGMGEGRDYRAVGVCGYWWRGSVTGGQEGGFWLGVLQIKGEFVIFALVIV